VIAIIYYTIDYSNVPYTSLSSWEVNFLTRWGNGSGRKELIVLVIGGLFISLQPAD